MRYLIDTEDESILCLPAGAGPEDAHASRLPFYSREAFKLLSGLWRRQEWHLEHWQSFSWLGFPIWQLPEDLLRIQELIVTLRPEVILETGLKYGGSAIFFASLCRLLGQGRVVSVEVQIPARVRDALAASPWGAGITLIEGNSIDPQVVARVRADIGAAKRVLVFLDSDHSKAHVLGELQAYADLVTPGSYAVVTDGVMRDLADTPRGRPQWRDDNPAAAAAEFAARHPEFVLERPRALSHDECVLPELSFWPDAWLRRR